MIRIEEGIKLTKHELAALLAFSADDPKNAKLYGVHFLCTEEHVKARATNGAIALDAVGTNDVGTENEWFVHRDFLKGALKALENTNTLTLNFSGASLYDAVIHSDEDVALSTFSWPHDAANSQTSFPDKSEWDKLLVPPKGKNTKCVTLNTEYLSLMAKVSKAAGTYGIDCYPPPGPHDRVVFRCEGAGTTWIALVMPMRSDSSEVDEA